MNIAAARSLARYRLFRPLAMHSAHYVSHGTDRDLGDSIAKWASDVLLGGHRYDLGTKPEYVFQVQSNLINRMVYLIPVWDSELVRKIVLSAEKKTSKVLKGCGNGPIEELNFSGGMLVLKRYFFRGTAAYQLHHKSETGWFVEDRYHMDVYADGTCKSEEGQRPSVIRGKKGKVHDSGALRKEPVLRVFHDSIGCVMTPRVSPDPDIDKYNLSIWENLPEYYPSADEIILSWHELAAFLKVQDTGIYALSSIMAAHEQGLIAPNIIRANLMGDYYETDGHLERVRFMPESIDSTQPLQAAYTRRYARFMAQYFTQLLNMPVPTPYTPDTYSRTLPPSGEVGKAIVLFLQTQSGRSAEYIGNGFFSMKSTNGTALAAGTGNWGSSEYSGIGIVTGPDEGPNTGSGGSGDVTGQGATGLTVDLVRYFMKDEIEAEIQACRSGATSAECQECVEGSTGDTFHDISIAADFVDVVAGIAACVLVTIFAPVAAPFVCGVTLPSAGAAAKDFWDKTFGGYNYAKDMCYGLPDQTPTSGGGGDSHPGLDNAEKEKEKFIELCKKSKGFPVVERIHSQNACMLDAERICIEKSTIQDATKRLVGAICVDSKDEETNDIVICVWCTSGTS